MMQHHVDTFGFFPFGLLSGLSGLLFMVGLVLVVVWLARALLASGRWGWSPPAPVPPHDILARRFAAGEITAEEYQKARDVLGEPPRR